MNTNTVKKPVSSSITINYHETAANEITHSLTNLSHGDISFTIVPDTGYELPASSAGITVANGTLVSYDSSTGVIIVSGDDTTIISVECEEQSGYSVTVQNNLGNRTIYDGQDNSGINLGTINSSETKTFTITSGYIYANDAHALFTGYHSYGNPYPISSDTTLSLISGGSND